MEINYEIKETDIGKGIFSTTFIKAGTRVWSYKLNKNVFEYDQDKCISYLNMLPTLKDQQHFLDMTFGKGNSLCLIIDDGQYMNHAPGLEANCKTDIENTNTGLGNTGFGNTNTGLGNTNTGLGNTNTGLGNTNTGLGNTNTGLGNSGSGNCYAIKDITSGEQLFEDYTTFSHPAFLYELLEKYNHKPTYYDLPDCK